MAQLILIRHGLSEWNHLGLWTGLTDVDLHPKGIEQAKNVARAIKDIHFDTVYVSELKRAQETFRHIKEALGIDATPQVCKGLNERDYGVYTGKNKWQVKEEVGEEEFTKIRRHWDHPFPGGETMKDVYHRVVPCFEDSILPDLMAGKNVLVVAHGNSIRALIKHLEKVADEKISEIRISVGEAHCYEFDAQGEVCAITVKNRTEGDV